MPVVKCSLEQSVIIPFLNESVLHCHLADKLTTWFGPLANCKITGVWPSDKSRPEFRGRSREEDFSHLGQLNKYQEQYTQKLTKQDKTQWAKLVLNPWGMECYWTWILVMVWNVGDSTWGKTKDDQSRLWLHKYNQCCLSRGECVWSPNKDTFCFIVAVGGSI